MPAGQGNSGQTTYWQPAGSGNRTGAPGGGTAPAAAAPAPPVYDENKYAQLYPNATPEQRRNQYNLDQQNAAQLASQAGHAPAAASLNLYQYGGDQEMARKLAGGAFLQAGTQAGHAAPQANFQPSQQDLNSARTGILAGAGRLGQAYGYGTQQQALADQLQSAALGQGPSVAELSMQRASAAEANRNLAMASGVGGPGAVAALINAQNQNRTNQGQLQQNLGIQRAGEIAQARGQLGDVLSGIRGQTAAEAQGYGNLGSQAAQIGQITGQQALGNAALQAGQNTLNQQGEQFYYGQGADWLKGQAGLNAQYATNWNNYTTGQQSLYNQSQQASQARNDALWGAIANGAATVGAAALTAGTGGAAAPVLAATIPGTVSSVAKAANAYNPPTNTVTNGSGLSDIRAKTAIAPAGGAVSQAFRGIASANRQADQSRGADTQYPQLSSSSYFYKDPNAPGAEPGQHFGPMAQELEQTPAGASVVRQMPDGSKGIDTGRLALLNASETAQLRRELDALKGKSGKAAKQISGTHVSYPGIRGSGAVPPTPAGAARPFAPGEYIDNNDGSWSSERSMTVQDPSFNGGRATVIPSLWIKDGKPYQARDEREAVALAKASKVPFRGYGNLKEADRYSINREKRWQGVTPETSGKIEPLWDSPQRSSYFYGP